MWLLSPSLAWCFPVRSYVLWAVVSVFWCAMQPCWPRRFQLLHFTLHTLHFILHSILDTLRSTLCTLHSTLHTFHPAPYTSLHSTLHTLQSPLHTLHTTFLTQHSTFFTLHPCFIFGGSPEIILCNILYQTLPCLSVLLIPTVRSWLFKKGIAALGHFRSLGSFHEGRVNFLLEN